MDIKKQFGDRRYKKTWILALARYEAPKSYETLGLGATVFRRFTGAIDANGGDADAIRDSIQTETQELFDCNVADLYGETGGTPNDRSTPLRKIDGYVS